MTLNRALPSQRGQGGKDGGYEVCSLFQGKDPPSGAEGHQQMGRCIG